MNAPLGIIGGGEFAVTIGPRRRDRMIAAVCGHRRSGSVSIRLGIEPVAGGERWHRTIEGRRRCTTLRVGSDHVLESKGPVELRFAHLPGSTSRLHLTSWALRLGPITVRLPRVLMPVVDCTTTTVGDGLHVTVRIADRHGRSIVTYEGTLR